VETLEVPVTQPLAVIKGDLAAITAQLEQWRGVEQDPPVWLDIEITTEDYLHDIQRQIQALTEDLPVEVLLVRRSREQREKILLNAQRETLSELKVEEVFERRLALTEIDDASAPGCTSCSPIRCIRSPRRTKTHENPQSASEKPQLPEGRMEDRLYRRAVRQQRPVRHYRRHRRRENHPARRHLPGALSRNAAPE
jgi:DNA repair exonuclease SbcCD nuclease subunit